MPDLNKIISSVLCSSDREGLGTPLSKVCSRGWGRKQVYSFCEGGQFHVQGSSLISKLCINSAHNGEREREISFHWSVTLGPGGVGGRNLCFVYQRGQFDGFLLCIKGDNLMALLGALLGTRWRNTHMHIYMHSQPQTHAQQQHTYIHLSEKLIQNFTTNIKDKRIATAFFFFFFFKVSLCFCAKKKKGGGGERRKKG